MTFLRENFPAALTFLYMPDEPGRSEYDYIRRLGENIHSNPGPGKSLPVFVTKRYTEELKDAIDIWDTGPLGFDVERRRARARAAGGGTGFTTAAGRRPAPSSSTRRPPTRARPPGPASSTTSRSTSSGTASTGSTTRQKQGTREQNVWADPITFDNRRQARKGPDDQGFINGDGVLIYPGEERLHPEEDRGVARPRLDRAARQLPPRALQDHQYLTLARKLGLTAEVEAALRAVVPRVFSEVPRGGAVAFAETGDAFESVRYTLARAIARASRDDGPRPRPSSGKRRGH